MSRGFTLLEVVVALLLMEIAVLAAVGTLAVASRALAEAEHLERAVLAVEGVLDSLGGVEAPVSGSGALAGGALDWTVDASGGVLIRASGPDGEALLEITSAVEVP